MLSSQILQHRLSFFSLSLYVVVLTHRGKKAAATSDSVAQRRLAAEFVLEPLVNVVGAYATFFSNHFARAAVVERWQNDPALARPLAAAASSSGGLKVWRVRRGLIFELTKKKKKQG